MQININITEPLRNLLPEGVYLSNGVYSLDENCIIESPIKLFRPASSIYAKQLGSFTYSWSPYGDCVESIGRFCSIAADVHFGLGAHPLDWVTTSNCSWDPNFWNKGLLNPACFWPPYDAPIKNEPNEGAIRVGNDVWIGQRAMIKPGVIIGDGAVIGANAIVTKDVAPYSVVGGVPAKIIKLRFTEAIIEELMQIEWWNYPLKVLEGVKFNDDPKKFIDAILVNTANLNKLGPALKSYKFSDIVALLETKKPI